MLTKPQLLVPDEPTSALDQRSEMPIGQTLKEPKGSVTVILIAHRQSTLDICTSILWLSDGFVKESPMLQFAK